MSRLKRRKPGTTVPVGIPYVPNPPLVINQIRQRGRTLERKRTPEALRHAGKVPPFGCNKEETNPIMGWTLPPSHHHPLLVLVGLRNSRRRTEDLLLVGKAPPSGCSNEEKNPIMGWTRPTSHHHPLLLLVGLQNSKRRMCEALLLVGKAPPSLRIRSKRRIVPKKKSLAWMLRQSHLPRLLSVGLLPPQRKAVANNSDAAPPQVACLVGLVMAKGQWMVPQKKEICWMPLPNPYLPSDDQEMAKRH